MLRGGLGWKAMYFECRREGNEKEGIYISDLPLDVVWRRHSSRCCGMGILYN